MGTSEKCSLICFRAYHLQKIQNWSQKLSLTVATLVDFVRQIAAFIYAVADVIGVQNTFQVVAYKRAV